MFGKSRRIEEQAFYDATQGVKPDHRLAEIEGHFALEQENLRAAAVRPQKRLEALIDTLGARNDEVQKIWTSLNTVARKTPPQIVLPLLAVISAAAVIPAETVFLAPVLDGLGISDPDQQLLLAGVLVLFSSGLLKIALHLLSNLQNQGAEILNAKEVSSPAASQEPADAHTAGAIPESPARPSPSSTAPAESSVARGFKAATSALMILFALAITSILGWWRAEELLFAGSIGAGELGKFLNQNANLTRVLISLLTVGLSVFSAIALAYGLDSLDSAWHWRKTRRAQRRCTEELNDARKQLEASQALTDHQVAASERTCEQWRSAYLHHHELGKIVGAHRRPFGFVKAKIGVVAVLTFALWLLLDPVTSIYIQSPVNRVMLAVLLTFGLAGLYAACAVRLWDRPSPRELFKHRRVVWREETRRLSAAPPVPSATNAGRDNGDEVPAPDWATRRKHQTTRHL